MIAAFVVFMTVSFLVILWVLKHNGIITLEFTSKLNPFKKSNYESYFRSKDKAECLKEKYDKTLSETKKYKGKAKKEIEEILNEE